MVSVFTQLVEQRAARYQDLNQHLVLQYFLQHFQRQFGDTLEAVVLYGSALRNEDYSDGLLDFYVLLHDYSSDFYSQLERVANKLLPPNVYYYRFELDERVYQAKYATISIKQLRKRVSGGAFHPYFWARFCQPTAIIYAKQDQIYRQVMEVQEQAIETFLTKTVETTKGDQSGLNLWRTGFQLTYRTELRAESSGRADVVYEYDAHIYDEMQREFLQHYALNRNGKKNPRRLISPIFVWRVRNVWGKIVSILRLSKALFTFSSGVEYIIWKIERHNNTRIQVSQRVKDHPLLFAWPLLYRLWRSGMIR